MNTYLYTKNEDYIQLQIKKFVWKLSKQIGLNLVALTVKNIFYRLTSKKITCVVKSQDRNLK